MFVSFPVLLQSCHREDDADGQEQELESFEVNYSALSKLLSFNVAALFLLLHFHGFIVLVNSRRKSWRSKSCCSSRPGFISVELQRWSCRSSVPAEVGHHRHHSSPAA